MSKQASERLSNPFCLPDGCKGNFLSLIRGQPFRDLHPTKSQFLAHFGAREWVLVALAGALAGLLFDPRAGGFEP